MPHDVRKSLEDIRAALAELTGFTGGLTFDEYAANRQLRLAIERLFIIVGEAMMRVRAIQPDLLADIKEYRQIIAFRNILVHGYDVLSDEVVWQIIADDLPVLSADLEQLFGLTEDE